MIDDWRCKNSRNDLPFIFVQLPIFGNPSKNDEASSWANFREAQKEVLNLPATAMAAALDLGEYNDLHPINKKDVGYRLYLAAEKLINKKQNSSPGPMLSGFWRQDNSLVISFDNCAEGLTAVEQAFISIFDGDTASWIRLAAEIKSKDRITIDLSSVKNPQKVLYAWADNPEDRQLYNSDGLPVIPFKINNINNEDNNV
jgi:sialate O-acetylesterase